LIILPKASISLVHPKDTILMVHLTEQDSHSGDLPGDEAVSEQAHGVEAEEVVMATVTMDHTKDLLTDRERGHQTQTTMRAKSMATMDQGAQVAVAEEDTGVDGAATDTEDHLINQEHQVGLT